MPLPSEITPQPVSVVSKLILRSTIRLPSEYCTHFRRQESLGALHWCQWEANPILTDAYPDFYHWMINLIWVGEVYVLQMEDLVTTHLRQMLQFHGLTNDATPSVNQLQSLLLSYLPYLHDNNKYSKTHCLLYSSAS